MFKIKILFSILICFPILLCAQVNTKADVLKIAETQSRLNEQVLKDKLLSLSKMKGWSLIKKGSNGSIALLVGVDSAGYPLYVTTFSNAAAAATIKTNQIWPGGRTGLNLNGSSANMRGKLGIWDGGRIRSTHIEFVNRILQKDNPPDPQDHATHVAGTLIASGVNPAARGMAFGLQQLIAYDFASDVSEMFGEANNLLVSNHSYGNLAGWNYNEEEKRWEFYGEANATQDYKFGYYSNKAQLWDSIAYNAPYYLIVNAAGNSRNINGPAVGQPYWRYDANNNLIDAGTRSEGISSNDAFDIIPGEATSKNILTIGAVAGIAGGYSRREDVLISAFTGFGPSDDGRIKPEVVADGVNLFSPIATADNAYATYSGTSMATPNAAGSLFLLQEHYSKINNGSFMRSATLKGLAIHTTDDGGPSAGPDYQNGFGLLNIERAANVISQRNTDHLIQENVLNNGAVFSLPVIASGKGNIVATICWTDPKGTVDFANRLNSRTKKLVNDLDIIIRRGSNVYRPWVLNPLQPTAAAVRGDNTTDNVEKIEIFDVVPGETYTIEIRHKGTLQRGQQAYSLLVSGVGGKAYCTSASTVNTGARINNVTLGNLNFNSPQGCTSYTNLTGNTVSIQANQNLTLSVSVSSCDASVQNKVVKAFIDWNNDGDFSDAGETVAQSNVIAANGVFTAAITTPQTLSPEFYTLLRVVVQETSTAADVNPCGSYSKGETQDYRIQILSPSTDVGISEIISPEVSTCSNGAQLITVRVKNFGAATQSNIPLTVAVRNGNTVVANLTAVYPLSIAGFADAIYTFQSPVNLVAGATYTLTAGTSLTTDQNKNNDQLAQTTVTTVTAAPTGTAEICANEARLTATPTGSDVHFWYENATSTTPIASGDTTTTVIPANRTYYLAKNIRAKVGPETKLAYLGGGYNTFSGNYVNFTNTVPVVIESVRLYIGNPGKVTITVADIISTDANGSYNYRTISSTLLNVYATTPNPQAGAVNVNSALDTGAIFYLNLPVPTTGNHAIILQTSDGATVFRNNGVSPNPYPISIPGVFSITGNSATSATDPNFFRNFYYFFYAMTVKTAGCVSARVPITATNPLPPTVTVNGSVLTSSIAAGNQWYRNNVLIPGATSASYTATESGIYKVVNSSNPACTTTSNEITVTITPGGPVVVIGGDVDLKVYPNPNNGQFTIDFEAKEKGDVGLRLVNNMGQTVFSASYPDFIGRFTRQVNAGSHPGGLYTLRVDHNGEVYVKKVIINSK